MLHRFRPYHVPTSSVSEVFETLVLYFRALLESIRCIFPAKRMKIRDRGLAMSETGQIFPHANIGMPEEAWWTHCPAFLRIGRKKSEGRTIVYCWRCEQELSEFGSPSTIDELLSSIK